MEFDLQHPLTEAEIQAWKDAKEAALLNQIADLERRVSVLETKGTK